MKNLFFRKEINFSKIDGIVRHVSFRLIDSTDAEFIYSLRINENKNRYLTPVNGDIAQQEQWIHQYKKRENSFKEFYWIICGTENIPLGAIRMYDFVDDSFCWGSWILIDRAPVYAAMESALMIYEIGFFKMNFLQSHFDVRKKNERVVKFHKKFGAKIVREDALNYYFIYNIDDYRNIRKTYKKFFHEML